MAETAFSSIKRMFGEHIMATSFKNMVKEMILKVSLYNYLEEQYEKNENWLTRTSYTTEQKKNNRFTKTIR